MLLLIIIVIILPLFSTVGSVGGSSGGEFSFSTFTMWTLVCNINLPKCLGTGSSQSYQGSE